MDRRSLLKLSMLGVTTAAVPTLVTAKSTGHMAGGLYYTKEQPGRWSKKATGHLPVIEKKADGKIKVTTGHEMNPHKHYIVKHVILDQDYQFIAENMFDPTKDKVAVSTFDLGSYKGNINVLSVCNKHDTWLNTASV